MTNMKPLEGEYTLESHLLRIQNLGYTLVFDALPPDLVSRLVDKMDELMPTHGLCRQISPGSQTPECTTRDINRLYELDPLFEDLMDYPTVFPIVEAAMEGDITLFGSAIADLMPPGSATRSPPWHRDGRDGPYFRFTYFLTDLTEDGGPTAVLPGTHRAESGPPDWFRTPDRIPKEIPGMVKVVVPAGTCMINDTNIWHTSTPNFSENPRKLIWTVFKTADQALPSEDLRNSQWFVDRQTDPLRRKLCGTDV